MQMVTIHVTLVNRDIFSIVLIVLVRHAHRPYQTVLNVTLIKITNVTSVQLGTYCQVINANKLYSKMLQIVCSTNHQTLIHVLCVNLVTFLTHQTILVSIVVHQYPIVLPAICKAITNVTHVVLETLLIITLVYKIITLARFQTVLFIILLIQVCVRYVI